MREKMGDMSSHDVARKAKAAGYSLSNGTVGNILRLTVQDVKEDTLRALAHVFHVPPAEVFRVYYGNSLGGLKAEEESAVNYLRGLPEEKQTDAIIYLKMLYEQYAVPAGAAGADDKLKRTPRKGAAPSPAKDRKAVTEASHKPDKRRA